MAPLGRGVEMPHCTFNLELELHASLGGISSSVPNPHPTANPDFDQPLGHAMGSVLSNIAIKLGIIPATNYCRRRICELQIDDVTRCRNRPRRDSGHPVTSRVPLAQTSDKGYPPQGDLILRCSLTSTSTLQSGVVLVPEKANRSASSPLTDDSFSDDESEFVTGRTM